MSPLYQLKSTLASSIADEHAASPSQSATSKSSFGKNSFPFHDMRPPNTWNWPSYVISVSQNSVEHAVGWKVPATPLIPKTEGKIDPVGHC